MKTPERIDINEVGGPKPYYASDRNRYEDGTRIRAKHPRTIYEEFVRPRIEEGKNPKLFPTEFMLELANRQGISEHTLEQILNVSSGYMSGLLNNGCNCGSHSLPKPLQYKMAALTGTTRTFWTSRYFDAAQADQLSIVTMDISKTNALFQPNGHFANKDKAVSSVRSAGK